MLGFSKKTVKESSVVTTSANTLSKEIDNLVSSFTKMISDLKAKAGVADAAKSKKQEEIAILQTECSNLEAVSNRANALAERISNIFCEQGSEK